MQVTSATNSVAKTETKGINIVYSLGILVVLLISFAVVSWVAANWSVMTTDTRLRLVQSVFIASIILAIASCWRNKKITLFAIRFATLVTGALLALIGQIYQTGADTWTLFALWALLITPWLLFYKDLFIIVLWAVLLNLAVLLININQFIWWQDHLWRDASLALVILNFIFLLGSQIFSRWIDDPWFILRRLFALASFAWVFTYLLYLSDFSAAPIYPYLLSFVYLAAMYYWFTKIQHDLFIVTFAFLTAIVNLSMLVGISWIDTLGDIVAVALLLFVCGVMAIVKLGSLFKKYNPGNNSSPWYFLIFRIGILLIVSLLLLIWIAIGFDFDSEQGYLTTGIVLILLGLALANIYRFGAASEDDGTSFNLVHEIALVFVFLGFCVFLSYWAIEDTYGNLFQRLGFIFIVSALVYIGTNSFLMRLLSSFFGLACMLFIGLFNYDIYNYDEVSAVMGNVYLLGIMPFAGVALWLVKVKKLNEYLRPVSLSLLMLSLIYATAADALNDYPIWLWRVSFGLWLSLILIAATTLIPLFLFWPSIKRMELSRAYELTVAALLLISSLALTGAFTFTVALVILALGHNRKNLPLLAFGVLAGLAGLLLYYFQTATSLVVKAIQMGGIGLLLLVAVLLIRKSAGLITVNSYYLRVNKYFLANIVLGAVLVLGCSYYQVAGYKNILKNGQEVVLELAPVDPRSLMQGDYMRLNYKVANNAYSQLQANSNLLNNITYAHQGWIILVDGGDDIWDLRAIGTDKKEALEAAAKAGGVALSFSLSDYQVNFGANSWFFPEGTGNKYASAKYGVLRVDGDGTALIASLLDDKKQLIN